MNVLVLNEPIFARDYCQLLLHCFPSAAASRHTSEHHSVMPAHRVVAPNGAKHGSKWDWTTAAADS